MMVESLIEIRLVLDVSEITEIQMKKFGLELVFFIRTSDLSLITLKIEYSGGTLQAWVDVTSNGNAYVECFKQQNVKLPPNHYFGLSAQTDDDSNGRTHFNHSSFISSTHFLIVPLNNHD